jgi:hypothetical protein
MYMTMKLLMRAAAKALLILNYTHNFCHDLRGKRHTAEQ